MARRTSTSRRHRRLGYTPTETRSTATGPRRTELADRPATAPAGDIPYSDTSYGDTSYGDTTYGDILLEVDLPPRQRSDAAHDQTDFIRQLYAEHGEPLMSYVLRLTAGDHHRAADIAQEALLRAWYCSATYHVEMLAAERGWVRSWLMRAAHDLTVDAYRSTAEANPTDVTPHDTAATAARDPAPNPAPNPAPDPASDRSGSALTALDVAHALSRLGPEHRTVLAQIYFENRTAAETAHRLRIPVGMVTSRTSHALRILRVMFDEKREQAG